MSQGIDELDHLLTYVPDLDQATLAYERLGFQLTPPSDITAMGIVNRLALMQPRTPGSANFIELMSVKDASLLPGPMQSILSGAPGIKSMVMMSRDVPAAHTALTARGYPFAEPAHVRREWAIPGEPSVWPEFDVLLPIPAPLAFNVCQYHNLELYLRPDWLKHPNGARHVLACLAVSPDPAATGAYFAELFGTQARDDGHGGLAISPAATELVIYDAQAYAERYGHAPAAQDGPAFAGYRIAVESLARLRALLADNGVEFQDHPDRLVVGPQFACGNLVEFVEADA